MSTNRINKGKKTGSNKLLLKKQQISRASLGGVTGGGEASRAISGVLSAIGSASSSVAETPVAAVTAPVSYELSAYDSDHLEQPIKDGAKKANDWAHKHLHISF
jgi:hypothetical protein